MSAQVVTENGEVVDGTALDVVERTVPAPLFAGSASEVVARATEVADALKDVIVKRRLFEKIQGKAHVKVEGWQLLGSMLGVTAVCVATERVENGWKATVEARMADGRVVGRADALCTSDEKRGPWKSADEYARLSMAQTRATSKALKGPLGFVISMAGYATTPAEEMPREMAGEAAPATEPRREPAPAALSAETMAALKDARQRAAVADNWLRMQMVAIGVDDVPERITLAAIRRMTEDQAELLLEALAQVADAKASGS